MADTLLRQWHMLRLIPLAPRKISTASDQPPEISRDLASPMSRSNVALRRPVILASTATGLSANSFDFSIRSSAPRMSPFMARALAAACSFLNSMLRLLRVFSVFRVWIMRSTAFWSGACSLTFSISAMAASMSPDALSSSDFAMPDSKTDLRSSVTFSRVVYEGPLEADSNSISFLMASSICPEDSRCSASVRRRCICLSCSSACIRARSSLIAASISSGSDA